ncbi:helix-turn-helix domain-containing protein [uncultured Alistipes sp.]|uniref:helix-turn-helix domain-containing protein n=1 Tax=uncultured Alistipes sp. TaxID=538949 RepID=UPI0027D98F72|nr:helix-turn-helix domain-containing protein [uncultured Alistipes sp.]
MLYPAGILIFGVVNDLGSYIYIAEYIAPAFSAISCAILLMLSYANSFTHTEVKIKRIAILYLCASGFSWASTFIYIYFPPLFVYIQAATYLSMLYAQVLFYRLFHLLTSVRDSERFSVWHYLVPAIISGTLMVWSFFVPYQVQLEIVEGLGKVVPEGYEVYSRFFMSKMGMRFLYSLIYMTLVFVRLTRYYKTINNSPNLVRRPARWIKLLAVLTVASVIVSYIGTLMRSVGLYRSLLAAVASAAIIAQHILMTYHIIQRGYLLYITFPGREHTELKRGKGKAAATTSGQAAPGVETTEATGDRKRKVYSRNSGEILNRANFDAYWKTHKPYLDPSFRITDLVDTLEVNRSYLSAFVNRTYGVNFNRYVNRCRLQELDRLVKLPSNTDKPLQELTAKAGFSEFRHYQRAVAAEVSGGSTNIESRK